MCSERFFGLDHSFDSVVHVLDEFNFISSKSSQVGDIENTVVSLGMLTMDTSDLHMVLIGDRLMEFWLSHQFW